MNFNETAGREIETAKDNLQIVQTKECSAGVFGEYPRELAEFLANNLQAWRDAKEDETFGHRNKFRVAAELGGGLAYDLYFKSKFDKVGDGSQIIGAKEQLAVAKYEIAEGQKSEGRKEILWSSVLHELNINRDSSRRYKAKFGEDLPIEQPVGFVVDRGGRKWSIFKFIDKIIDIEKLDTTEQEKLKLKAKKFVDLIAPRLKEIGINSQEIDKENHKSPIMENIIFVGNSEFPDQAKPMLIDSEEWGYEQA